MIDIIFIYINLQENQIIMKKEMKLSCCLIYLVVMGHYLLNFYFAPFALSRGISDSIVGMIISLNSIIIIILTPFYSLIVNKLGRKNTFIHSCYVQVFPQAKY